MNNYQMKIKKLRIENNETQNQIAELLNTTAQYYQKYEKGKHPLPIDHLRTLCQHFNVSADYVLDLGDIRMTSKEAITKFREEMYSIMNWAEFQGHIKFKDKDAILNAIDETEEELLKEVQP